MQFSSAVFPVGQAVFREWVTRWDWHPYPGNSTIANFELQLRGPAYGQLNSRQLFGKSFSEMLVVDTWPRQDRPTHRTALRRADESARHDVAGERLSRRCRVQLDEEVEEIQAAWRVLTLAHLPVCLI